MSTSKLYTLNFEQLSPIESELVSLAQPESKLSPEKKRAIISLVAGAIALIDIVSILDCIDPTPNGIDPTPNGSESILNGVESIPGGEGGVAKAAACVSGCLPHSNKIFPQKFPKNCNANARQILNRIKSLISSLDSVTLSEDEWNESYELHINRRKSKNPVSTRRVRW